MKHSEKTIKLTFSNHVKSMFNEFEELATNWENFFPVEITDVIETFANKSGSHFAEFIRVSKLFQLFTEFQLEFSKWCSVEDDELIIITKEENIPIDLEELESLSEHVTFDKLDIKTLQRRAIVEVLSKMGIVHIHSTSHLATDLDVDDYEDYLNKSIDEDMLQAVFIGNLDYTDEFNLTKAVKNYIFNILTGSN